MINPVSSFTQLQAPTEDTQAPPPPKPAPHTVEDKVTLSSVDRDSDGNSK